MDTISLGMLHAGFPSRLPVGKPHFAFATGDRDRGQRPRPGTEHTDWGLTNGQLIRHDFSRLGRAVATRFGLWS